MAALIPFFRPSRRRFDDLFPQETFLWPSSPKKKMAESTPPTRVTCARNTRHRPRSLRKLGALKIWRMGAFFEAGFPVPTTRPMAWPRLWALAVKYDRAHHRNVRFSGPIVAATFKF
jgi:hypothetical protein